MHINELAALAYEIKRSGQDTLLPFDWVNAPLKICMLTLSIHSKVSEALTVLKDKEYGSLHFFALALADIVLYVLSLGEGLGIDMEQAIREKIEIDKHKLNSVVKTI
jgi:NTP pyrophosphatase (non-canonical NTP hydrolase)